MNYIVHISAHLRLLRLITFVRVGNPFLEAKHFHTHSYMKLMKIIARYFQIDTAFYTDRLEPFINTTLRT
jgi:hypothetical protein